MALQTTTIQGQAVNVLRVGSDAMLLVEADDGSRYSLVLAVQIKAEARKALKYKEGQERKRVRVTFFVSSGTKYATSYRVL